MKVGKEGVPIFKLNFVSNKIVRTRAREEKIQIILDIDRVLTSDFYKIIFLILEHCYKAVEFNITNKNYLKHINL